MNLLRKYIRMLLTEAAMGPQDLPDGVVVVFEHESDGVTIYFGHEDDPTRRIRWADFGEITKLPHGSVGIDRVSSALGDCGGAWHVTGSYVKSGWGPMLYDIAIEYSTLHGGGLTSDRREVSTEARAVWDYYLNSRGDVTAHQLDDDEASLKNKHAQGDPDGMLSYLGVDAGSLDAEDNCDQSIAMFQGARSYPGDVEWAESSLS
ncbi:MAG TPA: hypothetical protein EYG51_16965, partial [Pseudomonadales bacterium]|nr:hypothetical protein [Pseudomonadales bacterium]